MSLARRYEYDPYSMIASAANAATWLLENDVASQEDIDTAMEIGMSWPRGPLAFADEYGIDRIVTRLEDLSQETENDLYESDPLLREMVQTGRLGTKSGEGFYEYPSESERFSGVVYEQCDWYAVIKFLSQNESDVGIRSVWKGLADAVERAGKNEDIRATLLVNLGSAFIDARYVSEMADWERVEDGERYFESIVAPATETVHTHTDPLIGVAEEDISDMGFELMLLCDMGVASAGKRIQFRTPAAGTFPSLSISDGANGLSRKKLKELLLTSSPISTSEAGTAGMFSYVVSSDQVKDVARELARTTTNSSPGAIAKAKELLRKSGDGTLTQAEVTESIAARARTEEGWHGLSSFLEDEKPRWRL